MSSFAKTARLCLFTIAVCCVSMFGDERPSALSLAVEADSSASAGDQAGAKNNWDDRALPLIASLTAGAPDLKQEPIAADSTVPDLKQEPTTADSALIAMLSEASAKWTELQSRIRADKETLAGCRSADRPCPAAARRFLSIVDLARQRQGRGRFGEINRAINLSIRPMSDLAQYGVEDYWASPLTVLGNGAGDCEDYAIAKYVALEESGVAPNELQLEIVRDVKNQTTHAVVAVHYKDEWLILDNRTLFMVNAEESPYHYMFTLDHQGVRTFAAEAALRQAVKEGVSVSYLQSAQAISVSANLANRLQKLN